MNLNNKQILIIFAVSAILIGTVIFIITRRRDNYVRSVENFPEQQTTETTSPISLNANSPVSLNAKCAYIYLTSDQIKQNNKPLLKSSLAKKLLASPQIMRLNAAYYSRLISKQPKTTNLKNPQLARKGVKATLPPGPSTTTMYPTTYPVENYNYQYCENFKSPVAIAKKELKELKESDSKFGLDSFGDSSGYLVDIPEEKKETESETVENPKLSQENFGPPDVTEAAMIKARADKQMDNYLTGIDDAEGSAVAGVLTSIYGVVKCQDSKDPNCLDSALKDLAIQVGIGLLKIGLACAGLGFINSGIDALMGGGTGLDPIDYNRIAGIVTDAVTKGAILKFVTDINTQISNIRSFIDHYTSAKSSSTQSSCNNSDTSQALIKCMKNPNYLFPDLKFDPSLIVLGTGTLDGATNKREYLKKWIQTGPLWALVNNPDSMGINGIINFGKINASASTQLYSSFKLMIGLYIVYYQEMSLIDQSTPGVGSINYVNPWMSMYIGDPNQLGKKQISGSLLGDLQNLCQYLFDYLKNTYLMYRQSLVWSEGDDCCGFWDGFRSCNCIKYGNITDNSGCCDQNWWNLINQRYHNPSFTWGPSMGEQLGQGVANANITFGWFMTFFDNYMNFPFTNLQVLKRMAGIDWLIGEQNFTYQTWLLNPAFSTNTNTIYSSTGGYPFGSAKMSYSEAIQSFKNKGNWNIGNNIQQGSSYCTPNITVEGSQGTCDTGYSYGSNIFDGTVFNIPGDPKTYTDKMYCQHGQSAISCVKPGYSPGTNTGVVEPDSRTAFCVDPKSDVISDLLTSSSGNQCVTQYQKVTFFISRSDNTLKVMNSYNPGTDNVAMPEFIRGIPGRGFPSGKYASMSIPSIPSIGQDVYDLTDYITALFDIYKSRYSIDLPAIPWLPPNNIIILHVPLSNRAPDPGRVNNTTMPPVNIETSITNYPINIISSEIDGGGTGAFLNLTFNIFKS